MPAKDHDIPLDFLRACFDLAPKTPSGVRWRHRPDMSPQWNGAWAGKPAGAPNGYGYFAISLILGGQRRFLQAHRVVYALTHGRWPRPGYEVDHEKGPEAGNGGSNLREATHAEQQHNRKIDPRNTSGYPGISLDKRRGKWSAKIALSRRSNWLGYFDTQRPPTAPVGRGRELPSVRPNPHGAFPRYAGRT